jgi:hypothetical protein
MLLDESRKYRTKGGNSSDSRLFVLTHQTAVTGCIRTEDGGEFAFETFLRHKRPHQDLGTSLREKSLIAGINIQRDICGQGQ